MITFGDGKLSGVYISVEILKHICGTSSDGTYVLMVYNDMEEDEPDPYGICHFTNSFGKLARVKLEIIEKT